MARARERGHSGAGGPGRWELRARQKVGVVRIGETTVWIRPKLTIARLLWLLGWARKSVFTIPAPVGLEETAELVPALAEAFCLHAERALETGLLQGYSQVEATEPVLRGRLRGDEQLGRRYGLALPLAVRYDDYLVDIPENQLLKGAVGRLLRVPGLAPGVQGRLRVLRLTLADVSAPAPGRLLPAWQPSRLNSRYHNALWLAEVILSGGSVEQEPGGIRVDGFLLDLDAVFEHFLTDTLTAGLERFGGRCQAQDPHTLDENGVIDIRPDSGLATRGATGRRGRRQVQSREAAGLPARRPVSSLCICDGLWPPTRAPRLRRGLRAGPPMDGARCRHTACCSLPGPLRGTR